MMVWGIVGVVAGAVAGAALIWLGILAATRATRLDRLNVRVDLARESLIAALERRAVIARALAAATEHPGLAIAADAAEQAEPEDREACENRLAATLAANAHRQRSPVLDRELDEAQQRIVMARRFYNDAVRDTRTLGSRRMVRWLHLGGHSQLPEYFEITDSL